MPDNQLHTAAKQRTEMLGRNWRVLIGVAVMFLGLGFSLGFSTHGFLVPSGQQKPSVISQETAQQTDQLVTNGYTTPEAPKPGSQTRPTQRVERSVDRITSQGKDPIKIDKEILGLIFAAICALTGILMIFRPPKQPPPIVNVLINVKENSPIAADQERKGPIVQAIQAGDTTNPIQIDLAGNATNRAENSADHSVIRNEEK